MFHSQPMESPLLKIFCEINNYILNLSLCNSGLDDPKIFKTHFVFFSVKYSRPFDSSKANIPLNPDISFPQEFGWLPLSPETFPTLALLSASLPLKSSDTLTATV